MFKTENLKLGEVITIPIDFVVTKMWLAGHSTYVELVNYDLNLSRNFYGEDLDEIMNSRSED